MELEGKSIVVTGGARGIGLVCARTLLERGARVTIGASSEASLEHAVEQLGGGESLATVASDIATVAGCEAVAAAARDAFGGIDALFTNAGLYHEGAVGEVGEDEWELIIDTNLKSTFFCIQAALPDLRRSRGAIVTMSSYHGVAGVPGVSLYGVAKAGVVQLTKALALELAPEVRVNAIAPGYVENERLLAQPNLDELVELFSEETPLARVGMREEMAQSLVFALENDFLSGAILTVDGGRCAGT